MVADSLTCDGPTLSGVFGPVAGVGDASADPEDQKWPVPENSQRSPDGRASQSVGTVGHQGFLSPHHIVFVVPPSRSINAPCKYRFCGDTIYATRFATSSGSPSFVMPASATICAAASAPLIPFSFDNVSSLVTNLAVRTAPGLIAFTCTPSPTPTSAIAFVNESIAALTEPPMVNCAPGVQPPTPAMFTTEPFRCFRIGHAARSSRTAPKNFSAKPSVQSSSLSVRKSPRLVAPALFTTISIPPRTSIVFPTSSDGASGFRKSSDRQTAFPPLFSISTRASFSNSVFRAASITAAPSSASFNAMALPIPRLAPVTIATLFDNGCFIGGKDKASSSYPQPCHFLGKWLKLS